MTRFYRIEGRLARGGPFVAGVELRLRGDTLVVLKTAPILYWMRGWSEQQLVAYCRRKGWNLELLP